MKKGIVVFILFVIMHGCGSDSGGSNGNSSFNDNNPNNNPVFISPSTISINENQVYVFKLQANDINSIKYYISGEDANRFNVDIITGEVTFKEPADFEIQSTYRFTATATDAIDHRVTQDIIIKILDIDEEQSDNTPPRFTSTTKQISVQENQTGVFRAIATDSNLVTYYISGGDDAGAFTIDRSTGIIIFLSAPIYDAQDFYRFTVTATDSQGNSNSQEVQVSIIAPQRVATTPTTTPTPTVSTPKTGFTRDDSKEVVIEHEVGLMWQDDEEAKTTVKRWLTQVNYDSEKYTDTSGYTAKTYCSNLTLAGYGDWRIPTLDELEHTSDSSRDDAPYIRSSFKNIALGIYWASDSNSNRSDLQWGVDFRDVSIHSYYKKYKAYVRCVRSMK